MSNLAPPLERLIDELCKLPSIGRKTAQRLAFHLLKVPEDRCTSLAEAIADLRRKIRFCRDCFNLADAELCPICADTRRERTVLCVVEEASNVVALERTGAFHGLYHVLGGALSPLKDVGPEQLHLQELLERLRTGSFQEVILGTNPDVEGEATAVFLARLLQPLNLRVTRLAQGLPAGGDLEFTDELTLTTALKYRQTF